MPDVTKFNTLTFDCYGTLIDWERGIHAELRPWLDRHGRRDIDDNALLETFGTIEAACEAETPGKLYPEILAEVHRRLADKWSIKSTAAEAAAFGQSVGRWPAFADSATSLQYLKRYYKLVILCNFEYALDDLERTFGTRKDDILHTAQSIFHDVVPARSVGLATMWINRRKSVGGWGATPAPKAPGELTTPDIEVASMADFVVLHQAHLRGESA